MRLRLKNGIEVMVVQGKQIVIFAFFKRLFYMCNYQRDSFFYLRIIKEFCLIFYKMFNFLFVEADFYFITLQICKATAEEPKEGEKKN